MRIYLREQREDDFEEFYKLKCQNNNIFWTNYTSEPDRTKLSEWYKGQLNNSNRNLLLALGIDMDEVIGYGYIDVVDFSKGIYEISYAISNEFIGYGLGTELVKVLSDYCYTNYSNVNEIQAWVLDNNLKSKKCLLRNGWKQTNEKKDIYFNPLKVNEVMIKFKL